MALKNSRILIHQPLGGFQGQASDIAIHAKETLNVRKKLDEIYAHHTGQDETQLREDMERDRWLSATEALKYGLVDKVITVPPTSK